MTGVWEIKLNGEELRDLQYEGIELYDVVRALAVSMKTGDRLEINCLLEE